MKMNKKFVVTTMICFVATIFPANVFALANAKTTATTTLRKQAGIVYDSIKSLNKGVAVEVVGKDLYWYKVISGGQTGYINDKSISFNDPKELKKYNPVKDNYVKIASYKTNFGLNDKNRNHNIELSAFKNSIILKSGESFSFNKNTGNSTLQSSGWRVSGIIVNKEYSKGVGGGICQTSSTIYSSVKTVPNITILQRQPHSVPVGYVPVSGEATVSYGGVDFRFRNDNKFDIFIFNDVNLIQGTLTSTVYKIDKNKTEIAKPIPTPTPEPINMNELAKTAYIKKLKDIQESPSMVFNNLKLNDSEEITNINDLSFTIDDLDNDSVNELLITGTVVFKENGPFIKEEQKVTTEQALQAQESEQPVITEESKTNETTDNTTVSVSKTYNYYMVYKNVPPSKSVTLVKSYNSLENNNKTSYKLSAYKEKTTGKVNWFVVTTDNTNNTMIANMINKNFKMEKSISKDEFEKNYKISTTNSNKLTLNEIKKYEVAKTDKPKINPIVVVNSKVIDYDTPPRIVDGSIYIEMRSLFESLGYEVGYNEETKAISITKGDINYFLENGVKSTTIKYSKNGETKDIPMALPLILVDDRTTFPLRFAGELLNYDVSWDDESFTASLNSK